MGYLVAHSGTGAVFLMFAAAGVVGAVAATAMLETRNRPWRRSPLRNHEDSMTSKKNTTKKYSCASPPSCLRGSTPVTFVV